jgi:hypothetical protein
MGERAKTEDEWQREATAAAIAAARRVVAGIGPLMTTPVGRLSDTEWGWIVTAGIFGWVQARCEQAIAEGLGQEAAVRRTGLSPSPCDVAVVAAILPKLADRADIDWSAPLSAWPKNTMVGFLMLAWQLITESETARDHGPGRIIRKSELDPELNDPIPFDL